MKLTFDCIAAHRQAVLRAAHDLGLQITHISTQVFEVEVADAGMAYYFGGVTSEHLSTPESRIRGIRVREDA